MTTRIWLGMITLYLVWGSTYLGIRYAVETIPPFLSAGLRFLTAGLILFSWRRLAGDPLPARRQIRSAGIVGLFLLLGGNGLVSWAEQSVPSGIAALLVGSTPMWLVGLEALRPGGARPGRQAILGLVVGLGGMALLVSRRDMGGSLNMSGAIAMLSATFLWASGSIYSRSADMPASVLMGTSLEMLIGSAGLLLVSGLLGEWGRFDLPGVAARSWLGLIYLITFGSLVAFVAYGWLLRHAPVKLIATYAFVNPVVAVFLGVWLAGERLDARTLVATGVIVVAVLLINTARQATQIVEEEVQSSTAP